MPYKYVILISLFSHCTDHGIDVPELQGHRTASGARFIDYIPVLNRVVRMDWKVVILPNQWVAHTNPLRQSLPIVLCKIAGMADERPCREMKKATELLHCNLPVKTLNNLIVIIVYELTGEVTI